MQLALKQARGFSIVEMAVVLAVVGLLIGGLLVPLATQMEQRNYEETQKRLESAREALLGFAITNGRLPCPASSASNGVESPSGGLAACTNYYDGFLPAATIGVQPTDSSGYALDAFNNRIRYVLATPSGCVTGNPAFSSSTNLKANGVQCKPADLRVCSSSQPTGGGFTSSSCGPATNDLVDTTNSVVAIVFSMGKNFATSDVTRTDELANTDNNATFVYHTPAPAGATGGEFDDQMIWIAPGQLYGRMVSAGVLP